MKIFSAEQIKNWDAFTIETEPISSIDLMERAATACFQWLVKSNLEGKQFHIFCGRGNNGGDGFAIARLLILNSCKTKVYIPQTEIPGSADFQSNLKRLTTANADIHFIESAVSFPAFEKNDIIIDAIFGSGLNRPLDGVFEGLVEHINNSNCKIIAIDLPTGLFADKSSVRNTVIHATHTLSFQNYKLALLLPENELFCGQVHLLDIGLHQAFEETQPADFELIDNALIKSFYKPRSTFAHKGNFGHAALLSGSIGMMGAAVLASKACLRAGTGKLTAYIPKCGYNIIQTAVPEAMVVVAGEDYLLSAPEIENYSAVGIGPGIGIYPSHKKLLEDIFDNVSSPTVIDADALNIMAENKELLKTVPANSIITPHPKEFERLFGKPANDFERLELSLQKAREHNIYIVLKGHYSFISTPQGKAYFNSTGNAGMATAGSGDVLTGITTGLLAQGYSPFESALMGVYLHGLAGDFAAGKYSSEAMIAGDIIECLGQSFNQLV